MAELKPGVIGTISGKIDNVVAANWRAIHYLRSLAKTGKKTPSELQVARRAIFTLLVDFLARFEKEINLGFQHLDQSRATAFNLATRANKLAVTGAYPDLAIDYASVVFSKGRLDPPLAVSVVSEVANTISITWDLMEDASEQTLSDKVMVVAYDATAKVKLVSLGKAVRGDQKLDLHFPDSLASHTIHVYIFFTDQGNKKNSESVYAGSVTAF
ncbi:DUF6266 family protein [Pararcticibacter amylolyticus]|uniref:Uncharacterized protein n=1 Tax=Pararcticibacter amylolyticus TaxID=2173175 RepID=A0A2U2P9Z2_9SPHI|nr:DUF6266 family protein [Pararcticibacter amylolyticus]PWG78193.1 hypothetical protein DDR33_23600 [Pararcticibacter amylolyticus]